MADLSMPRGATRPANRFAAAAIAAGVLVLSGPWLGQARTWMSTALPGRFSTVVNISVMLAAVAALAAALLRVRTHRVKRFAWISVGLGIAAISAVTNASASASQNAVERMHFVEYGVVTWLFYRAARLSHDEHDAAGPRDAAAADLSLIVVPALCGLAVGTVDEAFQWFVPERVGEWRDIFLNGTAVASGWCVSVGLDPPSSMRPGFTPRSARVAGALGAVVVLLFAAFVQVVHVGHRIDDPAVGTFDSRYTAGGLLARARDRTARWTRDPPPRVIRRVSREDQYLAEAAWHVQARNRAWEADVRTAWFENAILETYFAPALDQPSYLWDTARWPAGQRLDAERRKGPAAPIGFVSRAARLDLYPWPAAVLWPLAILAAGVVFRIPRRFLLLH